MTEVKEFTGPEIMENLNEEQRMTMATIHANSTEGVIARLVEMYNKEK